MHDGWDIHISYWLFFDCIRPPCLRLILLFIVLILLLAKLRLFAGLLAAQALGLVLLRHGLGARIGEVHLGKDGGRGEKVEVGVG